MTGEYAIRIDRPGCEPTFVQVNFCATASRGSQKPDGRPRSVAGIGQLGTHLNVGILKLEPLRRREASVGIGGNDRARPCKSFCGRTLLGFQGESGSSTDKRRQIIIQVVTACLADG